MTGRSQSVLCRSEMVFTYVHSILVLSLLTVGALFMVSCVILMLCGGIGAFRLFLPSKDRQLSEARMFARAMQIKRWSNWLWWAGLVIDALLILNAGLREMLI